MLRLIIIFLFSSTLFSQAQAESWLDYVFEENRKEISETSSVNIENEFYYTIQIAVKKTFDEARRKQISHKYFAKNKIDLVPFKHEKMDIWRHNFSGVKYHYKKSMRIG